MTIGIGAICENGKAVVMAADRLLTGLIAGLAIEMDGRKLRRLTDHAMMASTGTAQDAEFTQDRFREISDLLGVTSIFQIAERLRVACEQIRVRQIEAQILRRQFGISFEEFSKISLQSSNLNIVNINYDRIQGFKLELLLLIGGVDEAGAHLYRVNDSAVESYASIGFVAVGSGSTLASVALAFRGHSTAHSLSQTLYNVYVAKRAAERTEGVGPATDMAVIIQGQTADYVKPELIELLRGIYEKERPPVLSAEDKVEIERSITPPPPPEAPGGSTPDSPDPPPSPESAP